MKTPIPLPCLALAVVLACVQGRAQTSPPTIEFSSLQLKVGMPKDTVVARLAESYHLEPDEDSVLFFEKDNQGEPAEMAGRVFFRNGKLIAINKFWRSSFNKNEQEFADAFYRLVSSFERQGIRACTIGTDEKSGPRSHGKQAYIQCGAREIRILSFHRSNGQEIVQIYETLAAREGPRAVP